MEIPFIDEQLTFAQASVSFPGVKAVGEYYSFSYREISHSIKEGDTDAIRLAAKAMSALLPQSDNTLLIPVPSHHGKATYTLRLAEYIAKAGKGFVFNVLKCPEREPLYAIKKRGAYYSANKLGFYLQSPVPDNWNVVFIDNVVATGTTYKACTNLVGRGDMLVFAIASRSCPHQH